MMPSLLPEFVRLIKEELLQGVPEFVIRSASEQLVETIRGHIKKQIFSTKKNGAEQRHAIQEANELLAELETEVNKLVKNALWRYIQRT